MNNGDLIIISSAIDKDRRRELLNKPKWEAEDAKIGVRNARKDANTEIKIEKKVHQKIFVKALKKRFKT
jgi:ribosome recycling factor